MRDEDRSVLGKPPNYELHIPLHTGNPTIDAHVLVVRMSDGGVVRTDFDEYCGSGEQHGSTPEPWLRISNSGDAFRSASMDALPAVAHDVLSAMRRWESGKQVDFRDLNLVTRGSEIQRACYDYLLATEAGCFVSYCEIARAIARPKASRAVAHACAINPLPLFVPCHRVIPAQAARRIASGKSAHYGNYAYGAALKRALIEFEAGSR